MHAMNLLFGMSCSMVIDARDSNDVSTSFSWRGINNMNTISKASKLVLATMVIGACVTGCNRQSPESSEVSGTRSTDTTTASGARSGTSNSDAPYTSGTTADTSSSEAGTSGSGTSGTSATGGTGSTVGTVISDSVITTKVKTALLADSDIKGLDINVDTVKGEVKLSGAVNNQSQIERAEKIARNIDGVKGVQNKVTIKKS
jgi:hyperosmotically inducible protein